MATEASAPSSNGPKVLRTIFGVILCLAAVAVIWINRSATLGFSPLLSAGIFAIFLPFILLTWPSISFQKNGAKALLPAAIALFLVLLLQLLLGTTDTLFSDGISDPELKTSSLPKDILFYAAIAIATFLIFSIPDAKKRRKVILNSILTIAAVEGLFLGEEALFHHERNNFDEVVEGTLGKSGFVPTTGYLRVAKISPSNVTQAHYTAASDRKSYAINWRRILNPSYTISYSSEPDRVWITREAVR